MELDKFSLPTTLSSFSITPTFHSSKKRTEDIERQQQELIDWLATQTDDAKDNIAKLMYDAWQQGYDSGSERYY